MSTGATVPVPTEEDQAPVKIEFSKPQQDKVQELIDTAVGRNAHKIRKEFEDKINTLETELEEAKKTQKRASNPTQQAAADSDVELLRGTIEEMKTASKLSQAEVERWKKESLEKSKKLDEANANTLNLKKTSVLTNAASKHNFVNLDMVIKLTQDQVTYDKDQDRFIVLNNSGQQRLNASMEPMTLDEFYADFVNANKYLVRSEVGSGIGSTESARNSAFGRTKYTWDQVFGPKSSSATASKLIKEDPQEYKRLRAQAVDNGVLA